MKNLINRLKNLKIKIPNSPYVYIGALFFGILLMVAAVIALLNSNTNGSKKSQIISTTPTTYGALQINTKVVGAQFIFNNQVYYAPITITKILPGTYTVTVHNADYIDESYPITIASSKTVAISLKMKPLPSNASESEILQNRGEDENEQAMSYANQDSQEIQTRAASYPLTNFLPQVFGTIVFDYHTNSDGSVQYVIYALPGETYAKDSYAKQVQDFIQSKNIDPATIKIQWE